MLPLIRSILLACGLLVVLTGCKNPTAAPKSSKQRETSAGDQSAAPTLRLKGFDSESTESRYAFEFKNSKMEGVNGVCQEMTYHWDDNVVSFKNGELRVNGRVRAELEYGDTISIDETGIILVNEEIVWMAGSKE